MFTRHGEGGVANDSIERHRLGSDEVPDVSIDARDLAVVETYRPDAVQVFVGHLLANRHTIAAGGQRGLHTLQCGEGR